MSSTIVTCTCGAKVRVHTAPTEQVLRCPRCKSALPATNVAAVEVRSTTVASGGGSLCPICQTTTSGTVATHICTGCQQVYHQECWDEIGGCGTYGCSQAPAADKSEQSVQAPLSAWGDTKKCPACGETIKSIALRCRYCHTDFASVDPQSLADLHRQAATKQKDDALKKITVASFIASLIGCLAPFTLVFSLVYLLPRREQLTRCGLLFAIMAYTSVFLSGLYCILMVGFLVFGR